LFFTAMTRSNELDQVCWQRAPWPSRWRRLNSRSLALNRRCPFFPFSDGGHDRITPVRIARSGSGEKVGAVAVVPPYVPPPIAPSCRAESRPKLQTDSCSLSQGEMTIFANIVGCNETIDQRHALPFDVRETDASLGIWAPRASSASPPTQRRSRSRSIVPQ
jgi:hypothetical protein